MIEKKKNQLESEAMTSIEQTKGAVSQRLQQHLQKASSLLEMNKVNKSKWVMELMHTIAKNQKLVAAIQTQEGIRSLLEAASNAASLNLGFGGAIPHAYLVPFSNTVTLVISYRGMQAYSERQGVKILAINTVCANDKIGNLDLNTGDAPEHLISPLQERGETVGYYCCVKHLDSGFGRTVYMTTAEVQAYKQKYSLTHKDVSSPWNKSFEEMALKNCHKESAETSWLLCSATLAHGW